MSAHSPGFVGHADCLQSIDAAHVACSRVHVSVLGTRVSCGKLMNRSRCHLWGGGKLVWSKGPFIRQGPDPPPWKGALWREYLLAYCKQDCAEVGVQRLCGLLSEYFSHLFSVFQFIFFCRWKRRCNECGIISLTSQ